MVNGIDNSKEINDLITKLDISYPLCGFSVGSGWLPLVEKLINDITALGWDKNLQQVKEKFGALRFYVGSANEEIDKLIYAAEEESAKICENCGKPGRIGGKYWVKCLCEDCRDNE